MALSNPSWQPSCPSGGTWYVCGNGTRFTGCCQSYPCLDTGCPAGDLEPASFPPAQYSNIPDQKCTAGSGSWYKCSETTPPFLGCCKSNPCAGNGCPDTDLAGGYLSPNLTTANQFDPEPPLAAQDSSNPTNTSTPYTPSSSSSSSNAGAIVGGVVGGIGLITIVAALTYWLLIRPKRRRRDNKNNIALSGNKSDWALSGQSTPMSWEERMLQRPQPSLSPSSFAHNRSQSDDRTYVHEADSTTTGQKSSMLSPKSFGEQSTGEGLAWSPWSPDIQAEYRQSNLASTEARNSDMSELDGREQAAQSLGIVRVGTERYELNG